MKAITTRSGVAYKGPSIPTNPSPKKVVERETEETTDKEKTNFQGSTAHIPPPVNSILISELDVPKTLPKPNIPYPSRHNDQKSRDKASNQMEKIFQIIQDLCFDISFADALLLMPRFAPTIRNLLMNKEKLLELAKIPLNENCSAMLLKKLPKKLGDLGKFLIPCNFSGMDVCHALSDIGASINLMPLSIWKKLSLPELTPTRMTLELADRSITHPKRLAEDVYVKLKEYQSHLEYAYLEENDKLPVIIAKGLKDDEKDALLKVLKSHKRAIAWKITDIKGIDPRFFVHSKLDGQRFTNPQFKVKDGLWVSPVHCVPKKGGITVVANEENELIPTRIVEPVEKFVSSIEN
ncbi:reverse transcriptase domain-containing protein [Tanacetum coccineum]